jgi:hypothetical protein
MRPITTVRRVASLAALAAAAGSGALAGGASAASISTPVVLGPGERIPIDFPGYREPSDNRLPNGLRIVRRTAKLTRGEQMTVVMTAPQGFRIVTFGVSGRSEVGFRALDTRYPGRRSTRVQIRAADRRLEPGETGSGRIYLLARRA